MTAGPGCAPCSRRGPVEVVEREIRAGDLDRERVAESLRRHFADGRLTSEEFDERLSAAYAARTMGQLADLLADLPPDRAPSAVLRPGGSIAVGRPGLHPVLRAAWVGSVATYLTVSLLCAFIWLVTSPGEYFWPIWVIGPWGIVMFGGWLTVRRR